MNRVARATLAGLTTTVLAGGLLAACSGGGSDGAASTGASGSSTSVTSSASSSGSSSGSASSTTTQPTASPTGTVTPSTRPTQAVRPLRSTATFDSGVTVHVSSIRAVSVKGRGPGELSGPAVAVTMTLHNGTSKPVDVTNSVVTATYGKAATPAIDSSSSPSKPWRGTVKPGASATATYVFLVSGTQRKLVELTVSYDPTKPVVLLRGNASA